MKLMINHQTYYAYESTVKRSNQYIRLTPHSFAHQKVHHWQVGARGINPSQADGFGNIWHHLTVGEPHTELMIMAQGTVELLSAVEYVEDNRLSPMMFSYATDSTECDDALKDFVLSHADMADHQHLIHLAEAILAHMPYTPEVTSVETTAVEAFHLKKGVCQDHTQVFVASCRLLGVPARYVSGYLYTQDSAHMASHAWAEAYINGFWYTFDVSNQLFSPNQHVQVAIGRDYLDAAPVRGMRQGGGHESMKALVQVLAT